MKALTFSAFGGPEVLALTELPQPALLPGTAIVRMKAIGVNFADVYRRQGRYHLEGNAPFILGYEGAGVIESIQSGGDAVAGTFRVGDRVAFADVPHANAELVCAKLPHLVPLPEAISFEVAAALLLQGLTAQYLITDSHRLAKGELAVVLAAAGGVGALLCQLAKHAGANVLGVVSSAAKADVAKRAGADATCLTTDDWPARAKELSAGRGADVVYDSVGSTLSQSLDAARTSGAVVFYGMAGGDPAPVDPRRLMDRSLTLTGGDLWNVLTSSAERVSRSTRLFELVAKGALDVELRARFRSRAEQRRTRCWRAGRQLESCCSFRSWDRFEGLSRKLFPSTVLPLAITLLVAACSAFGGSDSTGQTTGDDAGVDSAIGDGGSVLPVGDSGGAVDSGPLPSGLIAHYKLDGDANDAVGGKNGTPKNVAWVPGVSGQAASCNGTSQIDLGDNFNGGLQSFSVLAWVNVDPADAGARYHTFVSKGVDWTNPNDAAAKGYGLGFGTADRSLTGATADGAAHLAAIQKGKLAAGSFRLVGMVVDRQTPRLYIYIDGVFAADSALPGDNLDTTATLYLCRYSGSLSHGLIGSIDEVMFFDRALTGFDVAAVKSHFGQ